MLRFCKRLAWLAILGGIVWAGMFLSSTAFGAQWKQFVVEQMARRGVFLDFRRLTLDPFRGLVARDVQLFNDEDRKSMVAALDRISLDFDIGRLLRGEVVMEALNLAHASLALPVDPQQPDLAVVEVHDLNARIFVRDDRLDVRRADGEMAGIHLSVTGSMILPRKDGEYAEKKKSREEAATKRMKFIRDNRQQIQTALKWLSRFQFTRKPQLTIEFDGMVERLQEMNARLTLAAGGLSYGTYVCQEVSAQAQYDAGFVDLTRLYLRDALGVLDASGSWQTGGDEVAFRLTSSADLHGMATAFFSSDLLKEAVFYEPANLTMDGTWFVGGARSKAERPLAVLGSLQGGRFNSRGEIFDGLAMQFGVDPAGFYVRDGLLRHKTGTLAFQAMFHEAQGLKYRATVKMDPTVFIPFMKQEKSRELIRRFGFHDGSSIFFRLEGAGPDARLASTKSRGRAELRDFSYRGTHFVSAEGDLELDGPIQIYRDFQARRREGEGSGKEVYVDPVNAWVRLTDIQGTMEPVAVTNCFAPKVAEHIARYKLGPTTSFRVSGTIGWKSTEHNDLKVAFADPSGTGTYPLWGENYQVSTPHGEIGYKKANLSYDINGGLYGRPMSAKGVVNLTPGTSEYTVSLKTGSFPYSVFGEKLPFEDVTAGIIAEKNTVTYDVAAKVLGGNITLKGDVAASGERLPYRGEVRVEAINFRRFAQTYSPGYDTEGDLTGHFNFTGILGDWKTLKGDGVGIIVNGNLYAIPVIGPLTPLLNAMIPAPIKGYNVAKKASCNFRVADGLIATDDVEAFTTTFRIVSRGVVDFIKDDIDFEAQARARGLPGIVLRPLSELLEFKGTGTVSNPKWAPTPFGFDFGKKDQRLTPPEPLNEPAKESEKGNGGLLKRLLPFGLGK